jgi:glycosyltransferase involved in cell wall biosynthesis
MVQANRQATDLKWRQPPRFNVQARQTTKPTAYYLSPEPSSHAGGIRVIYRHVDCLNSMGISAAVVHATAGFRATWFANETRVLAPAQVALGPDDVLVMPEYYAPGRGRLPDEARIVIFNQGAYHTFDRIPFATTEPGAPYADIKRLVALLTVSEDSAELLRYAFPAIPLHIARPVIDRALFHPADERPARRIAYMTHRRAQEREQLLHLLRARGVLDGWELAPIHRRTEHETAEILRGSAIFLGFSEREGFGLPPAEAMASGCYVVGYTGMGGREFFDSAYCTPVPDEDLLAFARAVEQACTAYDTDPDAFTKIGRMASEQILSRYSEEMLRSDLPAFYAALGFNA